MSILVTGATGKIGEYLVKALSKKGVAVTAFVRDVEKAKKLLGDVNFATGDLTDTFSFADAIKGKERLFLLTNDQKEEPRLVKIAKEAGVKHVVKISCIGASVGAEPGTVIYGHGVAETELLKFGVPVTFIRPHDFMQNLLAQAASIKGQGMFFHSTPGTPISSVHAHDIAAVAASVLTDSIDYHANITYTVTGPDAFTRDELAEKLSTILNKPIKAIAVSDADLFNSSLQRKVPRGFAHMMVTLGQFYRLYFGAGNRWITGNVELVTGTKPLSFEQFIEENKAAFL
mmetsp:Transcript_21840/g.36147  ORF Transcript_21840/g.36147 Transcript_21840/m.36147 type:complete len:287 (+) Transcript_21840:152-1012(+)|eukprot:CAMPEP_0184656892 /NCGR_PEP_ID=MMETSP0308-20130426/16825_1 /TAXON_ID=38269 /ORGANISM="Gloeochaete witrockiana, Strain SAG 46.84" /LENGTH=286 /DNA_ID=CAMNT_0027094205 /DNA_START=105 /DNA_END=965 /DNA_ORIENTATION=+